MPFGIQPIHIVIIVIVAFLIFGASKLPEIGHALGRTLTEFKKGTKEAAEGFKEEVSKPNGTPATSAAASTASPAASAQGPATMSSAGTGGQMGNFCIKCGAANPAEAQYCNSCGTKLPEKRA